MSIQQISKNLIKDSRECSSKLVFDNLDLVIDEYVNTGELTVIESRPAMGKTSFMLNIVAQMLKAGKRVLFISLELYANQIVGRLVPLFDNKTELANTDLIIDDSSCVDVDSLFNHKYIDNVDLVVIDYIGLLNLTKDTNSVFRDFSYILKRLKQLSVEKQVAVIVTSQLSRRAKEFSNFKEADNTINLYREPVYEENLDVNRIIESRVSKVGTDTEDVFYHHFGE